MKRLIVATTDVRLCPSGAVGGADSVGGGLLGLSTCKQATAVGADAADPSNPSAPLTVSTTATIVF